MHTELDGGDLCLQANCNNGMSNNLRQSAACLRACKPPPPPPSSCASDLAGAGKLAAKLDSKSDALAARPFASGASRAPHNSKLPH